MGVGDIEPPTPTGRRWGSLGAGCVLAVHDSGVSAGARFIVSPIGRGGPNTSARVEHPAGSAGGYNDSLRQPPQHRQSSVNEDVNPGAARSPRARATVVAFLLVFSALVAADTGARQQVWQAELDLPSAESVVAGPAGRIFSATSANPFSQTVGKTRSMIYAHDAAGDLLWKTKARGTWVRRIALSADGLVVMAAGLAGSEVWVAAYDAATGKRQWRRSFLPAGESGTSRVELSATGDGGVLLAGTTAGGVTIGGYFVSRVDSTGRVVWTRLYGQPSDGEQLFLLGLAADPRGAGHYVVGLDGPLRNTTTRFFFIVSYDDAGEAMWRREFGQKTRAATIAALLVAPNGRTVYVSGDADGAFFLRAVTRGGKVKKSRSLVPAQGPIDAAGVALSANGKSFHFTGQYSTEDGLRGLVVTTDKRLKKVRTVVSDGDPRFWDDYARLAATDDGFVVLESSSFDPPDRRPARLMRHVGHTRAARAETKKAAYSGRR